MKQLICYFDGACEPTNPGGNMGLGACIFATDSNTIRKEDEIFTYSDFYEADRRNSNNVAEYLAFQRLLEWIDKDFEPKKYGRNIQIWGDSKLVIMQMRGEWKMKSGFYIPVATECKKLLKELQSEGFKFSINWHRRELNHYADELSKRSLINNNVVFKIQPL